MTKVIDAPLFAKMIISGANNLSNNREFVDSLNVFPVPDGDTGTNMSLTFISAARAIEGCSFTTVTEIADVVAKATLRGARGNSGVILSQIFRGISKKLKGCKDINDLMLREALRGGSDTAYSAVMKPTEGTILTVVRSLAETAEASLETDMLHLFEVTVSGGNEALKMTQQMLPQLQQAGVVDAGGQGLMFIFEGFYKALCGEDVVLTGDAPAVSGRTAQSTIKTEDIKFAYCTEFIINKYNAKTSSAKMRAAIESKGDCMLVIDEEDIVKVHIHTNHPGYVLEQAVKIGELVNIKIENMKEQHTDIVGGASEASKKKKDRKPLGVVAVANGEGIEKTFRELGVDVIIRGGQTMNPSTDDILSAVEQACADNVIVLPNNKNIILAAQQVLDISDSNVKVLETKSIPQGIAAMMAFSAQNDIDSNLEKMQKAMGNIKSGSITHAVKDTEIDGKEIHEGDIIGVYSGSIVSVDTEINGAALSLIDEMADEDSEIITIYFGSDVKEEDAAELSDRVEEKYPDAEVYVSNGGQSVYYYIISIE